MRGLDEVVNLYGFESLAREAMSPEAYAYAAGGAADEVTLAANAAAFRSRRLRPRVLVDVSSVDPATEVLGRRIAMPLGIAPMGHQQLAHADGEVAMAEAAAGAGVPFCLSTFSYRPIEDVTAGARWLQLYVGKDRALSEEIVLRAVAAGYEAIMLTADLPVVGSRDREFAANVTIAPQDHGNFRSIIGGEEGLKSLVDLVLDPSLSWDDLGWLRSLSDLPLVLKGVLTAEDARRAAEHGVDAIVVSNHGGRQLDRSPATIDVLEEIVNAAGGDLEVYLDGGVRRGTEVVIALALGARAVFVGRPFFFALAAGGREGVAHGLALLRAEIENAMALLGARDVGEITREHVF